LVAAAAAVATEAAIPASYPLRRGFHHRERLRRYSVWEPQFPLDRLEARLVAQAIKERVGLGDYGFGRELSGFVWDIDGR